MSRAARLLLLSCALAAPAAAQQRQRTYLSEASEQAPAAWQLLGELDGAVQQGQAERAARAADRLLELCVDLETASAMVEAGPHRFEGLRAAALRRVAALAEPARAALRALQDQGATSLRLGDRPAPSELLARRFPLAADGREAAFDLLGRALEAGALERARGLRLALLRDHPQVAGQPRLLAHEALLALAAGDAAAVGTLLIPLRKAEGTGELVERLNRARQALAAAPRPAPPAAPPIGSGARLVQRASIPLPDGPGSEQQHCAAVPLVVGERVLVSTGSQLLALGLDGRVQARFPTLAESASPPPPEETRFAARLWTGGSVCATPLVLERWQTPARPGQSPDGVDPSFAGSFYSLLVAEPATGRVLWWDGDAGAGAGAAGEAPGARPAAPPGLGDAAPGLLQRLRQAHVIAVTGDAERLYAALLFQGDTMELALFAWRRDAGPQELILRPAWSAVTHVLHAERPAERSGDVAAVHPEVAAALALDPSGRLVLTSDLGIVAGLDASSGDLLWLRDAPPVATPPRPAFRPRGAMLVEAGEPPPIPPQPARPLPEGLVLAVQGQQVVALSPQDGQPAWTTALGEHLRTVDVGERLIGYTPERVVLLDRKTGRELFNLRLPAERCAGEAIAWGEAVLLPVRVEGSRGSFVRRVELRPDPLGGPGGLLLLDRLHATPNIEGPLNLARAGELLVVASNRRVSLLAFAEQGGR